MARSVLFAGFAVGLSGYDAQWHGKIAWESCSGTARKMLCTKRIISESTSLILCGACIKQVAWK